MEMKDIASKKDTDLVKLLMEKREELRTFRFNTAGSALRDVRAARTARRDIARILTQLNRPTA